MPQQPGYNKRLRAAASLIRDCIRVLAADASVWADNVWVVDSTPVECGRSWETVRCSDLAAWADADPAEASPTASARLQPTRQFSVDHHGSHHRK